MPSLFLAWSDLCRSEVAGHQLLVFAWPGQQGAVDQQQAVDQQLRTALADVRVKTMRILETQHFSSFFTACFYFMSCLRKSIIPRTVCIYAKGIYFFDLSGTFDFNLIVQKYLCCFLH